MRLRHTSRTDPLMEAERRQVSYRLSRYYRDRINEVIDDNGRRISAR